MAWGRVEAVATWNCGATGIVTTRYGANLDRGMHTTTQSRARRAVRRLESRLRNPAVSLPTIFTASFLEATVVPIPMEIVLVPLMLKARERLWSIALAALLGALAAAAVGYAVGLFFFDLVGRPALVWLDSMAAFEEVRERLVSHGFWVVFTIGVTAVPFQVATVGAGVTELGPLVFMTATLAARGLRYLGLATLVAVFGRPVERWIRANKRKAAVLSVVVLVGLAVILLR
jgi:membrane protein YqaA with SNARE-associated domain